MERKTSIPGFSGSYPQIKVENMKKACVGISLLIVGSIFVLGMVQGNAVQSPNDMVISFDLKGYFILVKCRINDAKEEYNFVVDTGALTFIDKTLADDLKLKQQGQMAKINRLLVGGYPVENVFVFTNFDLQLLKTASGITLHGIIGSDFLEDYLVTIDYEKQQLILSSASESLAAEKEKNGKGYLVPFKSHPINRSPMIKCNLNGMIEVEAMIDTGQPFSLVLPLNFLENTGALMQKETLKANGVIAKWPMTKSTDNYLSRVKSIEAGTLKMNKLTTFYAELPAVLSVPLLGKDFLSQFLVKINYPKNELLLLPRPGCRTKDNLFSAGLSLEEEGKDSVVVRGVWEKSPAYLAGLEVGDRILEFNSKKLTFESHQEFWLLLQDDKVKTIEVVIQKSNGSRKILLQKKNLLQ